MNFERNNLDRATSPYLQQHADNPVWWQEWKPEVLEYAREKDKVLFVSLGYATCHWCHVMARGAFSHPDVAAVLNRDFVSIKVDREQRPDIDQYLMDFLVATTGSGGWPLNAFLTPQGHPFFAMTFAAPTPTHGIPPFQEILRRVDDFYHDKKDRIQPFELRPSANLEKGFVDDENLGRALASVSGAYDAESGGLQGLQKFPPHCPNLFLLYGSNVTDGKEPDVRGRLKATFDAMSYRGLHDHVGGGFFRYCVDQEWRIPHFEKMLYDQAMMLWEFSLAGRVFDDEWYRRAAERTFACLERDFRLGALYVSSHDADTNHQEGATYLWDRRELAEILSPEQWEALSQSFVITEGGNFEGQNHLIMRDPSDTSQGGLAPKELDRVMARLLDVRSGRAQPAVDRKLITSWNALAAIGLLQLHRNLGVEAADTRAEEIFHSLLAEHFVDGRLSHSSHNGELQEEEFLSDYASLLLLATYLREDREIDGSIFASLSKRILAFRKAEGWFEAQNADFQPVPAAAYDMPSPSGVSLAELALLRYRIQEEELYDELGLTGTLQSTFLDIAALMAGGLFLEIESPEPQEWKKLPIHVIQRRGPNQTHCHRGVCHMGLPNPIQGGG